MKTTAKKLPIILISAMMLFSALQTGWATFSVAKSEIHAASPRIPVTSPRIPVTSPSAREAYPKHFVAKSETPRVPVTSPSAREAY